MARKKQFGVSANLSRGFSETIAIIENNEGKYKSTMLPLSRITLDPANPRKLSFTLKDAKEGINKNDPFYSNKTIEYEKLLDLATSIKKTGIINPIIVFKKDDDYQIVAGERRFLASILAGKNEIDARVFNSKPKDYSLKLLQWIENTAREDLSLFERIENIRDIFETYKKSNSSTNLSTGLLEKITGLSNATASLYFTVLNSPEQVLEQIKQGNINSLDKAVLISKATDETVQAQLLELCIKGATLKDLKQMTKSMRLNSKMKRKETIKKPTLGRTPTKVNLGSTNKLEVAKAIIEVILTSNKFKSLHNINIDIQVSSIKDATNTFNRILKLIEAEV